MGKFDEAILCCKRHLELAGQLGDEVREKLAEGVFLAISYAIIGSVIDFGSSLYRVFGRRFGRIDNFPIEQLNLPICSFWQDIGSRFVQKHFLPKLRRRLADGFFWQGISYFCQNECQYILVNSIQYGSELADS